MRTIKLTAARRKFRNRWMAFKIMCERPVTSGLVLATAKTNEEIYDFVDKNHLNNVYITFNGPAIPKGMAFDFTALLVKK